MSEPVLTPDEIAALFEQAEGLIGEMPAVSEGALLPDTYVYQYGEARAPIVRRAEAAMQAALEEAWRERAPDLPLSSPREALAGQRIPVKAAATSGSRGRTVRVHVEGGLVTVKEAAGSELPLLGRPA